MKKTKKPKARSGPVEYSGSGYHTVSKTGKRERREWKKKRQEIDRNEDVV